MQITTASFVLGVPNPQDLPPKALPEIALAGRSNVGKSSLINGLTQRRQLAHTSRTPGKTRSINLYLINNTWHLVDLPGYGYAKVSRKEREAFRDRITGYVGHRQQLHALLVLVDGRLVPQTIDIDFINTLGREGVPLILIRTKTDALTRSQNAQRRKEFEIELLKSWSSLPTIVDWSARTGNGRLELLDSIEKALTFAPPGKKPAA